MLPNLALLTQIPQHIFRLPNKRKESKRTEHYCLFLLCYQAGLRVSEAVNFDLSVRTHKDLYQITKTKGKKERLAYIPQQVIRELKKHSWKPNSTNRFNFYHFLRKIKRNLNISRNIELTPHTLRRSFATYHAENGLPLPLLSKLLGHSSVRTTALYWINTYHGGDDNDDSDNGAILCGKNWLAKHEENHPVQPKAPASSEIPPPPNLLNQLTENLRAEQTINQLLSTDLDNCQQQLSEKAQQIELLEKKLTQTEEQKATCQTDLADLNELNVNLHQEKAKIFTQKQQIQQDLAQAQQTISVTQKELASEQAKHLATESKLVQEKQISNDLRHQLQTERKTNANLRQKFHAYQNHAKLINTYQSTLKDKQVTEQELTKLTKEIKNFAQAFHQWQKINYYQQLEEQNELQAQIIQSQPPPWKPPN